MPEINGSDHLYDIDPGIEEGINELVKGEQGYTVGEALSGRDREKKAHQLASPYIRDVLDYISINLLEYTYPVKNDPESLRAFQTAQTRREESFNKYMQENNLELPRDYGDTMKFGEELKKQLTEQILKNANS